MSLSGPDISLEVMRLEAVSGVGVSDTFQLFRMTVPATTAAYLAPPSGERFAAVVICLFARDI
jgi:hypothetical protein